MAKEFIPCRADQQYFRLAVVKEVLRADIDKLVEAYRALGLEAKNLKNHGGRGRSTIEFQEVE